MPSLKDLPLEIRQKIYALVLVAPKEITVTVHSCWDSSFSNHTIKVSVVKNVDPTLSMVIDDALTQVNKEVRADSLPVLYGFNDFNFLSSISLEYFLNQIGLSRKYLRHVRISAGGYQHESGPICKATKGAFGLLELARGLQSLTVSHVDFCFGVHTTRHETGLENFADACSPLLKCLNHARKRDGVKGSVLDIVKIQLMECKGCGGCSLRGKQSTSRRIVCEPGAHAGHRCRCQCTEAETNNKGMEEQFKRL